MSTTAIVAATPQEPVIDIGRIIQLKNDWIDGKRRELEQASMAVKELRGLGVGEARIRRGQQRVTMLRKVVAALERGYIPIPRFEAEKMRPDVEEFPLAALAAVNMAEAEGIFDEIRFVRGRLPESPRGSRRIAQRDPLIVGVCRTPESMVEAEPYARDATMYGGKWVHRIPGREEHFLLAWWRPEDERDEVMF